LAILQITRSLLFRLMTLQFLQIFFTDDLTFMSVTGSISR